MKRKIVFCSLPWNWWNFMELEGVFEWPFWRKMSLNRSHFNTTQNGLALTKSLW